MCKVWLIMLFSSGNITTGGDLEKIYMNFQNNGMGRMADNIRPYKMPSVGADIIRPKNTVDNAIQ
ncbi:MAG: hypothetical protein FWG64_08065 [Firmicutes bacterium]|nr:hypothetical protein [Bacillota bacterium]